MADINPGKMTVVMFRYSTDTVFYSALIHRSWTNDPALEGLTVIVHGFCTGAVD